MWSKKNIRDTPDTDVAGYPTGQSKNRLPDARCRPDMVPDFQLNVQMSRKIWNKQRHKMWVSKVFFSCTINIAFFLHNSSNGVSFWKLHELIWLFLQFSRISGYFQYRYPAGYPASQIRYPAVYQISKKARLSGRMSGRPDIRCIYKKYAPVTGEISLSSASFSAYWNCLLQKPGGSWFDCTAHGHYLLNAPPLQSLNQLLKMFILQSLFWPDPTFRKSLMIRIGPYASNFT
jgi:hypothetical protein